MSTSTVSDHNFDAGDPGVNTTATATTTKTVGSLTFRVSESSSSHTAKQKTKKNDSNSATVKRVGSLTFSVSEPENERNDVSETPPSTSDTACVDLDDVLSLGGSGSNSGTNDKSQSSSQSNVGTWGQPVLSARHILERRKVRLEPGFSQVAWMEKTNLRRVPRKKRIDQFELRRHCTQRSLWVAYKGMVYDCTPYIP